MLQYFLCQQIYIYTGSGRRNEGWHVWYTLKQFDKVVGHWLRCVEYGPRRITAFFLFYAPLRFRLHRTSVQSCWEC